MVEPTPLFRSLQALGDHQGGPPDPPDDDMHTRLVNMEALAAKTGERLMVIERDLAVVKSNYATKEDVSRAEGSLLVKIAESKNSIIMWVVSAIFLAQLLPGLLKKLGL